MKKTISSAFFVLFSTQIAFAITPQIGEIKDSRSTGQFFNNLEIELKLIGDDFVDASAIRWRALVATDDTGRDLIDAKENQAEFQDTMRWGRQDNTLRIKLRNPARKAQVVKELSGNIDIYNAKIDPASVIKIPAVLSRTKLPIDNALLKSLGIKFTVMTPTERRELDQAKSAAILGNVFAGSMRGDGESDKKGLVVDIEDPQSKLIYYHMENPAGKQLKTSSSMTINGVKTQYYEEPLTADSVLVLHVGTAKSLTSVPLKLVDVALP
jgi:hypothetical protein